MTARRWSLTGDPTATTEAVAGVQRISVLSEQITGPKGADGGSGSIADGSITVAKLAFDPATQAELDVHTGATTAAHGGIVAATDPRLTDARTPLAHTHPESDVTGLSADLAARVPSTRTITTTAPLAGGGDLTGDRTLTVAGASTAAAGVVRLATAAERDAGVNAMTAMTPADVAARLAAVIGAAPGALDTLAELAAALGNDANYAATVTTALAGKQPLDADLSAIAALASAADRVPYSTGAQAWALTVLTGFARTLLDDGDAATARATLGLGTAATAATADFVAPTVVDAKGDLLVASAADTITRLAAGTNGHVLTADSTAAVGVKWAAASGGGSGLPAQPLFAGVTDAGTPFTGVPGVGIFNAGVGVSLAANQFHYTPMVVRANLTLTQAECRITTAIASGLVRGAIYAVGTDWSAPGALVSDFGTVTTDATGRKVISSLSIPLTPGYYVVRCWASAACGVEARYCTCTEWSGHPVEQNHPAGSITGTRTFAAAETPGQAGTGVTNPGHIYSFWTFLWSPT